MNEAICSEGEEPTTEYVKSDSEKGVERDEGNEGNEGKAQPKENFMNWEDEQYGTQEPTLS
jgi:hypothetical protein